MKPDKIDPDIVLNIINIDIRLLRKMYIDLRIFDFPNGYNKLNLDAVYIKESFNDILTSDEVIDFIKNKYHFPDNFIYKQEMYNKIYVYIAVALVGVNDSLVINEMERLGYFLSLKGQKQIINDMFYQVLRFEPDYQLQTDETEYIKSNYEFLYHITPKYNVNDILKNGLKPLSNNKVYNFPPRIYLIRPDIDPYDLNILIQNLSMTNTDKRNDGIYKLLKVNIKTIDNRFYLDPNSDAGVYTNTLILPENISVERELYSKPLNLVKK